MRADKNIFSKEKLQERWKQLYSSKPKKKRLTSRGVDGITIEKFEKNKTFYLSELSRELANDTFKFQKLYSYYEPREGKSPRHIQAPTVRDRIILSIINKHLMENGLAASFQEIGIVGSVKGTTLKLVIKKVLKFEKMGLNYVFKTDIIDYFPSIKIKRLKKIISFALKKEPYLREMIFLFLEVSDHQGVAQGSAVSPLLANLYLSSFDKQLSKRKKVKHFRYVDDILVFCKNKKEAKQLYFLTKSRLKMFGLRIHSLSSGIKTKIVPLRSKSLDILGICFTKNGLKIKQSKVEDFREKTINQIRKLAILSQKESIQKSLKNFINYINYRITGWASAYAFCEEEKLFLVLDEEIKKKFQSLLDQVSSRINLSKEQRKRAMESINSLAKIRRRILANGS